MRLILAAFLLAAPSMAATPAIAQTAQKTVEERVAAVAIKDFKSKPDEIVDDARLREDLSTDSIDVVEFFVDVEGEFNIAFTDEETDKAQTIGDVVALVKAKLKS